METAARARELGTESAFTVLARAQALERAGRDVVNLGIGQPDFPIAPHIVAAVERALHDGPHGYTDAQGTPALREAVAAHLGREGHRVEPGCVVILPGAKVGLLFAALTFGEPGTEILYPDPGFPIYASVARASGAAPVPYPLSEGAGFGLRAEDVLARITPRTRLLLVNSPGNPTGGVTSAGELDALVRGLERWPQVAILSDEIYRPIHFGDAPPRSLLAYPELRDRLVILDGWSKAYAMTGWRLGYTIWPASLVEIAVRWCVNNHSCVNTLAQAAGIAALEGPQDALVEMVATFARRRDVLVRELASVPGFRCPEPLGAFYAFPDVRGTGRSAQELQDELLEEAGVATIAGTSFGAAGEGYLRLSFASSEAQLREACARIRAHLG